MSSQPVRAVEGIGARSSSPGDATSGRRNGMDIGLFWVMCLIWGTTWIPIKIGVQAVSPVVFAAVRGIAAGALLLLFAALRGARVVPAGRDLPTVAAAALLANAVTYALLFWGMRHTDTGMSAVVNLTLTPVALLAIGTLLREEKISRSKVVALVFGAAGLALLFFEKLRLDVPTAELFGLGAVAVAAVSFAGGTVVVRPMTAVYSATVMSAWILLLGGLTLGVGAIATGVDLGAELPKLWQTQIFYAWFYLVFFGSIVGHTIFLRLSDAWTPSLAGLYAFVSPVIAVLAGVVLIGERLSATAAGGMTLLLLTTLLVLRR